MGPAAVGVATGTLVVDVTRAVLLLVTTGVIVARAVLVEDTTGVGLLPAGAQVAVGPPGAVYVRVLKPL